MQETTFSGQFVPGMRFLVFEFAEKEWSVSARVHSGPQRENWRQRASVMRRQMRPDDFLDA
eukprot:1058215-Rhodomonas_salina.2